MKQFLCGVLLWWTALACYAQPTTIPVSTNKTVSIIFPLPIKHIDKGSADILVEPITAVDNVLLIKAGRKNFDPTNLSVLTSDGNMYTFSLNYASDPALWVYKLPSLSGQTIEEYAKGVIDNGRVTHGVKAQNWGISAIVKGIYIKDETLFYHIKLENTSSINYDVESIRIYIRDQRKMKRTASQEIELTPQFIIGNIKMVQSGGESETVIAIPKFTIPDKKLLVIAINEQAGGRNLLLRIPNRKIIKAKILPPVQ